MDRVAGERDIQPGMPVITGTGPVGRINKVFGDYADVTLISDASSSIEVVIPRTGGRGILTGLGKPTSYACTIQWLEAASKPESRVQVGDEVVTSGLGGVDVVVAGLADDSLSEPYARLMRRNPELTVLGITGDAKRAFLFELRPHRIPLGDASPDGLLGAIRAASRPDAN